MVRLDEHASYEVRYLVSEATALRVRDFAQCYLCLDEASVGRPNYAYEVHRLYLDSDYLRLYWEAIEDPEHRRHLRIRFHEVGPDTAVFVEHKHWNGDTAITETVCMRRSGLERLLSGQLLTDGDLVSRRSGRSEVAGEHFMQLLTTFGAKPKLHLAFQQESYVGVDHSCRINLRRHMVCEPEASGAPHSAFQNPQPLLAPGHVLLTLKFLDRYPDWFADMVQSHNLAEHEFDDYLGAVKAIGTHGMGASFTIQPRER